MKKNFLTASEVEMEMQEARNNAGFKFEAEAMLIDNMIKNAKRNNMVGDKLQVVIDPMYIHIPSWQRNLRLAKSLPIGSNYNKYKWDVPKVLYDNGKLYVIDGQHRIYGAFKAHRDEVVVEIMECSMEDAIGLFLAQTNDRTKMSPMDVYKAGLACGKPEYVRLKKICNSHNIAIKGEDSTGCVGTLTSISDGLRTDPAILDRMFGLLGKLQWNGYADSYNGKAYGANVIRMFNKLYAYYNGRIDEMENIIVKNCTGTKFFVDNIANHTLAQMFDCMSDIVRHEMERPTTRRQFKAI